jgi:hypothetical protein
MSPSLLRFLKATVAMAFAVLPLPLRAELPKAAETGGTRPFRMGFTGFVYAVTPEAVASTTAFCRKHGDLIAHHIEGAAWTEMHEGKPLPEALLKKWEEHRVRKSEGGKVYLALSPGRGELKVAEKCAPLARALKGKGYDDPAVIAAYLAYCEKAVEYFQPDWLVIGIEMNEVLTSNRAAWTAYLKLHEETWRALKKKHPQLPIAASLSLHNFYKGGDATFNEWQKLDTWNDFVAVSYYPFIAPDRYKPMDWLLGKVSAGGKPIAFVETNDAAEVLPLPMAKVTIQGSPEKQREYYERLLALAEKHRFEFIVSFVHQDYDALWDTIKATAPELFIAWKDCGFLDENGNARPALAVWDATFARTWKR